MKPEAIELNADTERGEVQVNLLRHEEGTVADPHIPNARKRGRKVQDWEARHLKDTTVTQRDQDGLP